MINPLFNYQEGRLRAFHRVIIFLIISSLLLVVPSLTKITWVDFTLRSILIFGFYMISIRYTDHRPWRESGLIFSRQWSRDLIAGIGIAAISMSCIFLIQWLTGTIEITGFGWQRNGTSYWLIPLFIYFIQMASVGFYEELIVRGYILRNLSEGLSIKKITPFWSVFLAIIISSALFGLGHAGNPNVTWLALTNILLAGIMLALPFVITGRLSLSIGLHFSWNFAQGGIFGFHVSGLDVRNSLIGIQQSGPDWWTGGVFGPEGGIIGVMGMLLIVCITLIYLKFEGEELRYHSSFTTNFLEKGNFKSER